MKVLLINPPDDLDAFLGKGKNFIPSFEPLGLLYISAVCKQNGHSVNVIDAVAERLSKEDIKNVIAKISPDVVGFTSFICNGGVIYDLGRHIKQEYPNVTVVFGNVHSSVYAEAYLRNACCDIVLHGEGEYGFLKILDVLEKKQKDFSGISCISYLKNGNYIANSEVALIDDLSKLPLPDRDSVNQKLYNIQSVTNSAYFGKKKSIGKHMFTSRGCPFSCSFCVVHNKRGQRCNTVSNVVDEMEILVKNYSTEYIFISDSLFTCNKNRVIDICKEIKNRRLGFKWGCEGHVNLVDRELAEIMESAGCYDIAFGIESGVQRILDGVRKGTRIKKIEETINIVKKYTKIKVSGLFILGLPGEAYKDSVQTIAFAKMLPLDMAQFSVLSPYPGSPIFYDLVKKGEIDSGLRPDGTLDTSVWLRYSAYICYTQQHPIWVTPELNADTLRKLQKKALREFYFRPKQLLRQLKRIHFFELHKILPMFKDTFF
jgi:anaerobic magnesium-protoporphyrin IX monomethyl ester cyclase